MHDNIEVLINKRVNNLTVTDNSISFELTDVTTGEESTVLMQHNQDCCESVYIESIDGDIMRLIGQTIIEAYSATNNDSPPLSSWDESYTWTFYTIRTNLDSVTIRWYGSSNGYYSESVDVCKLRKYND